MRGACPPKLRRPGLRSSVFGRVLAHLSLPFILPSLCGGQPAASPAQPGPVSSKCLQTSSLVCGPTFCCQPPLMEPNKELSVQGKLRRNRRSIHKNTLPPASPNRLAAWHKTLRLSRGSSSDAGRLLWHRTALISSLSTSFINSLSLSLSLSGTN